MSVKKRIVFNFDERSMRNLEGITNMGHHESMADALRAAILLYRSMLIQSINGYNTVVLRNKKGDEIVGNYQIDQLNHRE